MYANQTGSQGLVLKNPVKTAFTIINRVVVGTGSTYGADRIEKWSGHIQPRVSIIFYNPVATVKHRLVLDVRTSVEHIENIRSVLNPSVSDLAGLFDVTRQAVYKWLSGDSIPEPDKLNRIVKLSEIADTFNAAKISRAGSLLKMKAFNGQSLMDLLKTGDDCTAQVLALISEAKAMEASYQKSGLAASKAKPTNDWQAYVSIPGSIEPIN
jgi:transcriptional regulator with XRE-family HTH domain